MVGKFHKILWTNLTVSKKNKELKPIQKPWALLFVNI